MYAALVEELGGKIVESQQYDPTCTHLVISKCRYSRPLLGQESSLCFKIIVTEDHVVLFFRSNCVD